MHVKFGTNSTKPVSVDGEDTVHHLSASSGPTVPRQPPLCPLRWSDHRVWRKDGAESSVGQVIATHSITLLMFGSPCYLACEETVHRLRGLEPALEVVYVPVYTYRESALLVERDFLNNHGDWWTMGFQTLGAVEAVFVCGVTVLPAVVVVDCRGVVVSTTGQQDLDRWGDSAVIAWS